MRRSFAAESVLSSADRYAVRGVLILMVMFDHNDIVRAVRGVDAWFMPITWHVAGFLMLPFLANAWTLGKASVRDMAVRTLVPFAAATLAYAALFHLVRAPGQAGPLGGADWIVALLVGSAELLKPATGFLMLWFLPALFSTRLLLALIDARRGGAWFGLALAVGAASALAYLLVGALPYAAKAWVPQGVLIALYILPLGLLLRATMALLGDAWRRWWVAAVFAALSLACWWAMVGINVEVATLDLPTIATPGRVLLIGTTDVAFLVTLLGFAPLLSRVPFLALLGRHSLIVYLVHPLLYKPVFAALLPLSLQQDRATLAGSLTYWSIALASVAAVGVLSVAAATLVAEVGWLRHAVTPRDWADWRLAAWRPGRSVPLR